jgi:GNAT superfamily N-acetyltransferase
MLQMPKFKVATPEDFDAVYEMCQKFVKTTIYKDYFTEEAMRPLAETFILSPITEKVGLLAMDGDKPVGMLGGMINNFIFGNIKMAVEIAWWIEPEYRKSGYGKELIEAFEFWAKKNGCAFVTMSFLEDKPAKFYENVGYSFAEKSYIKRL